MGEQVFLGGYRWRVTTCRVGVVVSGLARHVEPTGRPYYAGQMKRELDAPVRIAVLAIGGSARRKWTSSPTLPGGGPSCPRTWRVPRVR